MTAIVALSSVIPTASNSAVPVERGRERIRSGLIDQMKVVPEEDMPEVGPSVSAEVEVEVGKFDLGAASIEKEEYDAGVEEAFDQQDEIKPIDGQKIWGLPDLSEGAGEEIAPGIKAVSIDELAHILQQYHQTDTPSSVLFPWLHGIGDGPDGADGTLERFLGNPPLDPPRYRGLCLLRAPDPPRTDRKGSRTRSTPVDIVPFVPEPTSSPATSPTTATATVANPTMATTSPGSVCHETPRSGSPVPIPGTDTVTDTAEGADRSEWESSARDRAGSLSTQGSFSSTSTTSTEPSLLSLSQPPKDGSHPYFTHQVYSKGPPTTASTNSSSNPYFNSSPSSSISSFQNLPTPKDDVPCPDSLDQEVGMHPTASKSAKVDTGRISETYKGTVPQILKSTPQVATSADPAEPSSCLRSPSVLTRSRTPSPYPSRPTTPFATGNSPMDVLMMMNVNAKLQAHAPQSQSHLSECITEDMELDSDSDESSTEEPPAYNSMLANSLLAQHVLNLSVDQLDQEDDCMEGIPAASFKPAGLSMEVSLRNLKIQEIKYATISHLVLYDRYGLPDDDDKWSNSHLAKIAYQTREAMDKVEHQRRLTFCGHVGHQTCTCAPIRYTLFVIRESFEDIVTKHPELLQRHSNGEIHDHWNLNFKETIESRNLSGATEISEGFWLGNGWDDPFRMENVVTNDLGVDLVIEAHDIGDMPIEAELIQAKTLLTRHDLKQNTSDHYLLKSKKRQQTTLMPPVFIECGSSSRSRACGTHEPEELARRLINLATLISQIVEDKDILKRDGSRGKGRVLAFCDDGYTETSILALTYLMVSQKMRLSEAYLHLQLVANRSFFVYPFDVRFLQLVESMVIQLHGSRSPRSMRFTRHLPKWKFGLGNAVHRPGAADPTVQTEPLESPSSSAIDKSWIEHFRFDGSVPSRILDHVYLGNMAHATNSQLLRALGITHIVSVGETILEEEPLIHNHYKLVTNVSIGARGSGESTPIGILEIDDVKDDGNDPLRHKIAHACEFIEGVRMQGGKTLVHCRVGVSRSATIVIAYLIRYHNKNLIDAYMMTRCRRLNVLIQPNLRFLHELLGWEIQVMEERKDRGKEHQASEWLSRYTWPALCRDIWHLNRKYLA